MLTRNIIIAIVGITTITACSGGHDKIGVIDLPSLYNSFDYQKELSLEFEKIDKRTDQIIDSLDRSMVQFEVYMTQTDAYAASEKNIIYENSYLSYLQEKQFYEHTRDSIADSYTSKVWKQLNSYVSDFGSQSDYDVIIGMQGDGNVMYVSEGVNITEEVLQYANDKYNGK